MNEKNTDIFGMEANEFDAWLAKATRSDFLATADAVTSKLACGGKALSQEEIRRINAYGDRLKSICWPIRLVEWLATELPLYLIDTFQTYLIVSKAFGFGPFCGMSWGATLSPFMISTACLTLFAAIDAGRGK